MMSFVGMHLDVVTANPDTWSFDPFSMSREGVSARGVAGGCCGGTGNVMRHMCGHSHGPVSTAFNPFP